ncbi:hypothetical protein BOX15_Mlig016798g1 [Macrostomum lignano]|uniref:RanBP2-type domain-containing protein n=1 Tax=Macrostomum lignano TaxID=282301 RepID=A0A267H8A0_9PLAT|nr:hypothetical protein BOX15_Mlig016798g1 [Macrostomum lignano]
MTQRHQTDRQSAERQLRAEYPEFSEQCIQQTLEAHEFSLSRCREALNQLRGRQQAKPKRRFKWRWPKLGGGNRGGSSRQLSPTAAAAPAAAEATATNGSAAAAVQPVGQMSDVDHHVAVQRHSLNRIASARSTSSNSLTLAWRAVTARREMLALLLPMHVSATQNGVSQGAASSVIFELARDTLLNDIRQLNRQWATLNSSRGDWQQQQQHTLAPSSAVTRRRPKFGCNSGGGGSGSADSGQAPRHQRVSVSLLPAPSGAAGAPPPILLFRPSSVPQEAAPAPSLPPWHCQCCTFANHPDLLECEMCSAERPQLQRPRAASISLDRPTARS